VYLVTDSPSTAPQPPPTLLLTGAAILLAVFVAAALIALARSRLDRHAPEIAFRRLARRLGVHEGARATLRALARVHGDMTPTALLLSDHALAEAVRAWAASGTGGDLRPRVLELLARRGLETTLVPAPRATPRTARPPRA
jgi:hypothetical protein